MDLPLLIRHRLLVLALEQKDLAAAAQVTESYISQLLARKKTPPDPARSDIYERMSALLQVPAGELARLALMQRQEEIKRRVASPTRPLYRQLRELLLAKCAPRVAPEVARLFEQHPFGELERLVAQTLLAVARPAGTDAFVISQESSVPLLEPVIDSWDIDLRTFAIEISLKSGVGQVGVRRFEFAELSPSPEAPPEPGFTEFLQNPAMSGDATPEEIEFLRRLDFRQRSPTALYYYRELQSLRDPLHFPGSSTRLPR